jgi:pyruvate ferredoxin oxidoreductase beta subunit
LVKLGKLAVDTAMWVLLEIENGVLRLTGRSRSMARSGKKKPVSQYLKLQGRFKHITPEQIDYLQAWVDKRWQRFLQRHERAEEA